MDDDNRPLSPHLQIYRWQLTMVLSIVHRATGIALLGGSIALVFWLAALAAGPEVFGIAQKVAASWLGLLILLGFTATLFFHLSNGIRHLFWDIGMGFERRQAYLSGVAVLVATALLTLLAWGVGLYYGGMS